MILVVLVSLSHKMSQHVCSFHSFVCHHLTQRGNCHRASARRHTRSLWPVLRAPWDPSFKECETRFLRASLFKRTSLQDFLCAPQFAMITNVFYLFALHELNLFLLLHPLH